MPKDNFAPPLIFRYATVMTGLLTVRMENAAGRVVPADILDTLMACIIDLANEAGIEPTALREDCRKMLLDLPGAIEAAERATKTTNDLPC